MATFHLSWTIANITGTEYVKVKYRIKGTSIWSAFNVPISGTTGTAEFQADNNRIYDVQYQNVNNNDNPLSAITNGIGFSDPNPGIFPTNTSVGYVFDNLSEDIDSYTIQVAQFDAPTTIIGSQVLSPADPVEGEITGLTALTQYYLYITPAASQFSQTFTYVFITETASGCPSVQNVVATLS